MASRLKKYTGELDTVFSKYYEINALSDKLQMPNLLKPLFYIDSNNKSFIESYFIDRISNNESQESVFDDTEHFFNAFVRFFFDSLELKATLNHLNSVNISSINDAITHLPIPLELKLSIPTILFNIQSSKELLTNTINSYYDVLKRYYAKNTKSISQIQSIICDEFSFELLSKSVNTTPQALRKSTYCISFLNPWTYQSITRVHDTLFILGKSFSDVISYNASDSLIDLDSVALLLTNDYIRKICEVLVQHGEMTSAELARALHITQTGISRHISKMKSCGIILISRTTNTSIYYKLNMKYNELGQQIVYDYMNKMININL